MKGGEKDMIKQFSVIAGITLLATIAAPVAFAQTVDISGNGAGSSNLVVVVEGGQSSMPDVTQQSVTKVLTMTVVGANTGNNTVAGTTQSGAGDQASGVVTGVVDVAVTNTVTGGNNTTTVANPCGCEPVVTDVTVSGNGNRTRNAVIILSPAQGSNSVRQRNVFGVGLGAFVGTNTGNNKVKGTTQSGSGAGTVGILTGNTTVTVNNRVTAGSNNASL